MIKAPVLLDGKPLYRVTEIIAMEIPVPGDSGDVWRYVAGPAYIQWRNEDGSKGCAYVKSGKGVDGVHYERATIEDVLECCANQVAAAFKLKVSP